MSYLIRKVLGEAEIPQDAATAQLRTDYVKIFKTLKPGQVIWIRGRKIGMFSGGRAPLIQLRVGRKSKTKKGVETITLLPVDGSKPPLHASYRLYYRPPKEEGSEGSVMLAYGDMPVKLYGIHV